MVGKVWGLTCGGRTPPNSVGLTGSTRLHEHNWQKHIQHTTISTSTPILAILAHRHKQHRKMHIQHTTNASTSTTRKGTSSTTGCTSTSRKQQRERWWNILEVRFEEEVAFRSHFPYTSLPEPSTDLSIFHTFPIMILDKALSLGLCHKKLHRLTW